MKPLPSALIRLNKAHFPVTVLGPGRRIGLWVQGCSLHCRGCVSQDTWAVDSGTTLPVNLLLEWCQSVADDRLDGVTISGGEPFEQSEALAELLDGLQQWRTTRPEPFDILCYSGLSYTRLQTEFPSILARLDGLIPEPYLNHHPLGEAWRGSDNQPLIALSPLGETRYGATVPLPPARKRLQINVENEAVWFIGIPDRGDLADLEQRCRDRGLTLGEVSWRP